MSREFQAEQDDAVGQWLLERHAAIARDRSQDEQAIEFPTSVDETTRAELKKADFCLRILEDLQRDWRDGAARANTGDSEIAEDRDLPSHVGRFEIERELGRGGAGVVFLAYDPDLMRHIALKVPRPEAFVYRDLRERFVREARAVASLDHPHIVPVYEVGEAGAICYIASAFVDGTTLAAHLASGQEVPAPRQAACWVKLLADAAAHAHQRGILHRDIKPGNILLDKRGESSEEPDCGEAIVPRLADFGLAKLLDADAEITRTGSILGTPAYMAPEQAEGRLASIDERTDVYALGAVLYELLTGQPPIRGESDADTLRRILTDEPTRPRRIRSDVPSDLEAIALKCVEKSPARRYASADELSADLERYLNNQPVRAKPATPFERMVKWSRRHSDMAWVSVGFLILFSIGFAIAAGTILRFYRDSEYHRGRASAQLRQTRIAQSDAERHRDALRQEVYSLDMQAAFAAKDHGRLDEVRELLQKHVPVDSEADVRSFSWYALHEMATRPLPIIPHGTTYVIHDSMIEGEPLISVRGHYGAVREVAMHPDGKRLVTAGDDGTLRIWTLENLELRQSIAVGDDPLHALALSPDGKYAITGNQTLQLWALDDGSHLANLAWFETTIEEVAYSPDGRYVASGSRDSVIKLINLETNHTEEFDVVSANETLQFTDGGRTVTGVCKTDIGREVRSWDIATGKPVRTLSGDSVKSAALVVPSSNEARFAIVFNGSSGIKFWNVENDHEMDATPPIIDVLFDAALSSDNSLLAAGSGDGTLRVWRLNPQWADHDPSSVVWGREIAFPAHQGRVSSLAFTEDGRLVTAGADGMIRIWKVTPPRAPIHRLDDNVVRAVLTPDIRSFLTVRESGDIHIHETATGKSRGHIPFADATVIDVETCRDGTRFAVLDDTNTLTVCDLEPPHRIASFSWPHKVHDIALSFSGRLLAVTGVDGYTCVWDLRSKESVDARKLATWGRAVEFSPNEQLMALAGGDQELFIVDTESWDVVYRLHSVSDTWRMVFDPSGSQLASYHRDKRIRVWDLTVGQMRSEFDTAESGQIYCLAFHPTGDTLVAGVDDHLVSVWHLPTGRLHGSLFPSPLSTLKSARDVRFSPDGSTLFATVARRKYEDRSIIGLRTDWSTDEEDMESEPPQVSSADRTK